MKSFFKTQAGRPFFALGGQVHNSSAYDENSMKTGWRALMALHANLVEAPVYWEQIEPEEGVFDFTHLDRLVAGAQQRGLRLEILWFATWKNGSMQYAPAWVKQTPERFQRVIGPAGNALWVLSSHCEENFKADRRAFQAMMAHLRKIDREHRTVVAVQVENEPGILGAARDHGATAEAEFQSKIPDELARWLGVLPGGAVRQAWSDAGEATDGSWREVFGERAEEIFTAYSIARYIDGVARAGKEKYDLPCSVNVWLRENGWRIPGNSYPSGGAVSDMLDVWKLAAPHVDVIAPDIYIADLDTYREVCAAYTRPDNPLFVPESGWGEANALHVFEAVARYDAVGYAVFGIESILDEEGHVRPEAEPLVGSFRCLAAALPLVERLHGTGCIHAVLEREGRVEQRLDLGRYIGLARFDGRPMGGWSVTDFAHENLGKPKERGRGLVFQTGPHEFFLTGGGYTLTLRRKMGETLEFSRANADQDAPMAPYVRVEEGHFNPTGEWVVDRRRNGDEVAGGLWVSTDVGLVRAVLLAEAD